MTTTTKPNDIEAVAQAFYRNLGDGTKAGENLAKIIHAVVSSRDTTIFARYAHRVTSEKKDAGAGRSMRRVFKAVFPDAKIAQGKDGKTVFKISGVMHDESALKRMDQAVKDRVSLRGKFADIVVGESTKEPKEFDPRAAAERLVKAHKDKPSDIDALIAALQAARQKMVVNGEPNH